MDGAMTEAYGQRLGEALRVKNAPAIVTRALRKADIAVTEVRCDNPLPEMSGSIRREDAFLVVARLSAANPDCSSVFLLSSSSTVIFCLWVL
jgi:hypothetical protein